jgi:DNA-directed RNA polymerase subunit omega
MVDRSGDEVEEKVPSRYSMVIAVSKRAKQLRDGASSLVDSKSKNFITIAMEEIAAGAVKVVIPTQAEIEAASRRQELVPPMRPRAKEAAELLRVPTAFDLDEDEAELAGEELLAEAEISDVESLEEAEEAEEDNEEDIRPVDELMLNPSEPDLESTEIEEE